MVGRVVLSSSIAAEGPDAQTKFVTSKGAENGPAPYRVLNKVDKADAE